MRLFYSTDAALPQVVSPFVRTNTPARTFTQGGPERPDGATSTETVWPEYLYAGAQRSIPGSVNDRRRSSKVGSVTCAADGLISCSTPSSQQWSPKGRYQTVELFEYFKAYTFWEALLRYALQREVDPQKGSR